MNKLFSTFIVFLVLLVELLQLSYFLGRDPDYFALISELEPPPSGPNSNDATTSLPNTQMWQVFMERPFDYMFQVVWNKRKNCGKVARWMRQVVINTPSNSSTASIYNQKHIIHTELLQGMNSTTDSRKSQLPVLSFLATQKPTMTLNIWTRNMNDIRNPPAWLASLLDHKEYGKRLRLRLLEDESGMKNLPVSSEDLAALKEAAYGGVKLEGSSSDIRRYLVLYEHGGLWFDTDTLFLSDVRPLLGVDFVTITEKNWLNGAVIGTSKKKSVFMLETLKECARLFKMDPNHENYFRYGPTLLEGMRNDKSKPMPFRILPGCLVDSAWVGGFRGTFDWDRFFGMTIDETGRQYLANRDSGPFSHHWHGRWDVDILKGSPASVAHENYVIELDLQPRIFFKDAVVVEGVNCGKHRAYDCTACPMGNGEEWCNGECIWTKGQCILDLEGQRRSITSGVAHGVLRGNDDDDDNVSTN